MEFKRNLERQLKAVGTQRRLRILAFLKHKKHATVGEIAKELRCSSRAVSQHMRILRSAEIVTYTKRGSFVTYRLLLPQKQPVKQVINLL